MKKLNCLTVLVVFFLIGCGMIVKDKTIDRPATWEDIQPAVELLPEGYRADVLKAISISGYNERELIKSIREIPEAQREGLAFLLANMPQRDLKSLKSCFLVKNVELAYQAVEEVPWGKSIPKEIFLNYILPYASLNERREDWRTDFHQRFLEAALKSGSIEEAVLTFNSKAFKDYGIIYNIKKRPKPDQSPYETIEVKCASCTGLSIMLVDVLRSVGIPCRIAATPQWSDGSGNHTWVEVWDQGIWYYIGAAEPASYNDVWFKEKASQADCSKPEHCIYAVSFQKTDLLFPCLWDLTIDYVYAIDVTSDYQ